MTSKPLLDYINRYVQMSADEEAALLSKIIHRTYLKGQFIVQQGDVCKYESFILSGCLRTFYVDRDGQEYIVMFGVEGWWAADFDSFITEKPSHCANGPGFIMKCERASEKRLRILINNSRHHCALLLQKEPGTN